MKKPIFVFDLDSTITKEEILPVIARSVGLESKMRALTEAGMRGEIPFKESLLNRMALLKDVDIEKANEVITNIQLNRDIEQFIKENNDRCFIDIKNSSSK